jgi:DNA topoisomerase I
MRVADSCWLAKRYVRFKIIKPGMISKSEIRQVDDKKVYQAINGDLKEGMKVAGLVYVSDNKPGYTRKRRGKKFIYMDGDKQLIDQEEILRIKKLVIPPAWKNVWISKIPRGHLQATGYDKLGRKQYRYHEYWMEIRNKAKFYRLREFGEILPVIRSNLEKDLSLPGFPQNKVLAVMVSLLERINIRVGNPSYEKLYGSFGLTTLKNHHVAINGSRLRIMFRGKKGVLQDIAFTSRKLSKIIQGCKEIPGKELFEYYDEEGNIRVVDSGMVNNYIRSISGSDFTAKDFRTWAGTIHALLAFREVGKSETAAEMNRKIPEALDMVARQLGNTRAVCKKYYVHPLILQLYQDKKLDAYISELNDTEESNNGDGFARDEKVLLRILKSAL